MHITDYGTKLCFLLTDCEFAEDLRFIQTEESKGYKWFLASYFWKSDF